MNAHGVPPEKLTVRELLDRQKTDTVLGTIEPGDKTGYIKITQLGREGECGCSNSVTLPEEAVQHVELTGKHHYCCGKILEVVSITFAEDTRISIKELLAQFVAPKRRSQARATADARDPFTHPRTMTLGSFRKGIIPRRLRLRDGACGDGYQTVYYGAGSCPDGSGECLVECYAADPNDDYSFCEPC